MENLEVSLTSRTDQVEDRISILRDTDSRSKKQEMKFKK